MVMSPVWEAGVNNNRTMQLGPSNSNMRLNSKSKYAAFEPAQVATIACSLMYVIILIVIRLWMLYGASVAPMPSAAAATAGCGRSPSPNVTPPIRQLLTVLCVHFVTLTPHKGYFEQTYIKIPTKYQIYTEILT